MSLSRISLKQVLLIDAATCAIFGVALMLAAGLIASYTGIPPGLLSWAGLLLLPVAAFMAFVGTRRAVPPAGVRAIVLGNTGWIAASVALPFSGLIAPNALGVAFILVQALVVVALTWLEQAGLRAATLPAGSSPETAPAGR